MITSYKNNNGVVFACSYHVAWCAKYRRTVLTEDVSPVLEGLIRRVCLQRDAEVLELTILPDRVHLRVAVDPQLGIHRLVKQIKAVSSGQLRQEFADLRSRLPTLWSNSYFVSTSGSESEARLAEYLEEQKESPTRRKSAVAAA